MRLVLRWVLQATAAVIGIAGAFAAYGAPEILASRSRLYRSDYAWSDQRETMRVTTVDARGGRQERTIAIHERHYPDGSRKALLQFTAPDAVKGTALLSQQRARGAAERWLYLPRQKRARRFAGQRNFRQAVAQRARRVDAVAQIGEIAGTAAPHRQSRQGARQIGRGGAEDQA
jgi:hypothetical protein